MAFRKFANAAIVKPDIHPTGWGEIRQAGGANFAQREAAKVVLQEFDPKNFLLTHCTIIASVDTEESKEAMGKHSVDGFEVTRKYADYLITPDTNKYINNNHDAWEKKLLLACFRTFVGGENYVEHVQIPELSKGKIIDAAARDIGDSIYVDILVATDRKHSPLISAITDGQLQTLSMGCQVEFTTCTKCGNVAYDETQLCPHIRYFKGNEYVDGMGKKRKIAELCGHISEEPGSVKFIEASWVANPAFPGAVMRNILNPDDVKEVGTRMQVAFTQAPRVAEEGHILKAAKSLEFQKLADDFGEFPGAEGGEAPGGEQPPEPPDPIEKAVDSMANLIRQKALAKVKQDLDKGNAPSLPSENLNNNLIKEALLNPKWRRVAYSILQQVPEVESARRMLLGMILYRSGGWKAVQASSFHGTEFLALARLLEMGTRKAARAGHSRVYRTVLKVGGVKQYPNEKAYLTACSRVIGRRLTNSEEKDLLEKGYLYSLGS